MASRAIDLVITYRIIKLLVTPFERQEAYKQGIIDKDGNVLKKYRTLKTTKEKQSYTILHRFVFNLKRILKRVGLGGRLGSFAVALALLLKENKENEQGEVKPVYGQEPFMTCFGIDVYEKDGELYPEDKYENL